MNDLVLQAKPKMNLNSGIEQKEQNNRKGDIIINVDKWETTSDDHVKKLAHELNNLQRNNALATGGVI